MFFHGFDIMAPRGSAKIHLQKVVRHECAAQPSWTFASHSRLPRSTSPRRRLEERPLLRAAGGILACTLRWLAFALPRLALTLPVRPCAVSFPCAVASRRRDVRTPGAAAPSALDADGFRRWRRWRQLLGWWRKPEQRGLAPTNVLLLCGRRGRYDRWPSQWLAGSGQPEAGSGQPEA